MPKQRSAFRFLTKPEGSDQFEEIGQAWVTAKAECFSVSIDLENTGEKLRFLMVANRPAQKPRAVPDTKPAA